MKNFTRILKLVIFSSATLALLWMTFAPKAIDEVEIDSEIRTVLAKQDAAWNRGDIPVFMEDYWKSEDLRFASGGKINRGYQATLDGYLTRYPDKATMGTLAFTDLEIQAMSATDALVFGRWELERAEDKPGGLFTLHMRKIDGRWKIMSDHTSSN